MRCCANHGLSLVITARIGSDIRILLFDAGPEAYTISRNGDRLRTLFGEVGAIVLSHGHWDHGGGLPEDRIRFHTWYGVNFGPRLSDLQLEQVLILIFTIRAGAYSFEAANPRHEHEWRVATKLKLPDGNDVIPEISST